MSILSFLFFSFCFFVYRFVGVVWKNNVCWVRLSGWTRENAIIDA